MSTETKTASAWKRCPSCDGDGYPALHPDEVCEACGGDCYVPSEPKEDQDR